MVRLATLISGGITIVSLNGILWILGVFPDPTPVRPILDGLVLIFDFALVLSSSLLGRQFWRGQSRALGSVFFGNLGIFAIALGLRMGGVIFPRWAFATADLYWLNLYLIVAAWQWRSWSTPGR